VAHDVPLAPLTTLRVGPVARQVVTATTTDQVIAALTELRDEHPLVLGGGSNVVLSDDLAELTVVRIANAGVTVEGDLVRAEAGAVWDDVVVAALDAGLGGLECLSGIPGSAGATPVQNVGAYGVEVAQLIRRVRLLDRRAGEAVWVPGDQLGFGYRTSILKHGPEAGRHCVLEVEFALDPSGLSAPLRYGELATTLGAAAGDRIDAHRVRDAVLRLRRGKGMVLDDADHDTWSVGSFFTNPVVSTEVYAGIAAQFPDRRVPNYPAGADVKLAAGWLVEAAGFGKGFPGADAPARLSTKHALALTNRGHATSADVLALARTVRDGVHARFGIRLTPEPVIIGASV
jgi:UDP-N-acetylmuramate dehydrogenase